MKPLVLWAVCWALLSPAFRAEEATPESLSEVPHDVGSLGRSRCIDFEGNTTFPTATLRRALTRDIDFVLASHSAEPLDQFLSVITERLRQGYRHSGFPAAKVEANHRITGKQESILVSISEGPRYRQGAIRVEGDIRIDPTQLVKALEKVPDAKGAASYADRIRAHTASYEKDLPPSDGQAPDIAPSEDNVQAPAAYVQSLVSSKPKTLAWHPGEPLAFGDAGELPMIDLVSDRLAELGRPLAKITTRYDLHTDGTADLLIHIDHAGPVATVGAVTVEGNETNTAEEVRQLSGLTAGQAVTPARLDEAQLALWRCGRFFPFAIDMQPRESGSPEIDIKIRVRELEDVPPLSTPASPDQEVVLRFIDWLNSGFSGEELLFERDDPALGKLLVGWSPDDRAVVSFTPSASTTAVSTIISGEGALIAIRQGDRAHVARFSGVARNLCGTFHIVPTHNAKSKLAISAAMGFSTKGAGEFFSTDLLITPAYALLKPGEISRTGERVIISPAVMPYSIELDAATARPIAVTLGDAVCKITTARGSAHERQKKLEAEIELQDTDSSVAGWVDALAPILAKGSASDGGISITEPISDSARKGARLIDLLAKPEVLDSLKKVYSEIIAELASSPEFTIPVNAEQLGSNTTFDLMVGLGCLGLAEDYLPEAEWTGTFAREMLFILGGKTQHRAEVMNTLLADPAIGPFGCFICAELLDDIDPVSARRFRKKAREQCNAEAFRKDWKLLADSSGPVGNVFRRCLESIASISKEDETAASELLPKDLATWFRAFLNDLRQHPKGQPWSETISPRMDKLWEDVLGTALRDELDRALPPPIDPSEVAATIDDVPVPHYLVRILEQQHMGPMRTLAPGNDDTRVWAKDRALAGAIRMMIVRDYMQQAGRYPSEESIEEYLNQQFAHLADKPDDDWIHATGATRAHLAEWIGLYGCIHGLFVDLLTELEELPDDSVLRNFYKARSALYGNNVDTDMVYIRCAQETPGELARCYLRAEQLTKELESGRSAADLDASGQLNAEPIAQAFSNKDASLISFQLSASKAIASLKPGEVTEPMAMKNGVVVFALRATRPADAPDFEEVKDSVLEHWREHEVIRHARQWFEEREAAAKIQVLDTPHPSE